MAINIDCYEIGLDKILCSTIGTKMYVEVNINIIFIVILKSKGAISGSKAAQSLNNFNYLKDGSYKLRFLSIEEAVSKYEILIDIITHGARVLPLVHVG